jgi:signal transduction histidine kinase
MRVATRLALGSAVLLTVLFGALAYNLWLVNRLAVANQQLTSVTFRASRLTRELGEQLLTLKEWVDKLDATRGDPEYADKVLEARDAVAARLGELSNLPLATGEEQARSRLLELWQGFAFARIGKDVLIATLRRADRERTLAAFDAAIKELVGAARAANEAAQETITARVEDAARASQHAERVALTVMAIAVVISIAIVVLTLHSIHKPLQRLTEGTRAVAQGQFGYRLETSGPLELASLAEDFNSMVQRLGELEAWKRDFLSHVSHELRTPLVAMQETNQLLLEEAPGPLNERQRRLLDLNLQGAKRLSTMIANLLDLSRLDAGVMEYHIERRDLVPLVESAVAQLESWAAQRAVTLVMKKPAAPLPIDCDGDRITQVVVNLIDNGVKFSPEGVVVMVAIEVLDDAKTQVPARIRKAVIAAGRSRRFACVRVVDRGPGVSDREKEAIFERFYQSERSGKKSRGVGLGLAICRQIAESHRGALWVGDNPGGGSVFSLLLPLPTGEAEA